MKPEQLEYAAPGPGQCILHNIDGQLLVERADPVVAISEALIAEIRAGTAHAGLSLDGQTLVIDASGQRVAYRLGACKQPGYLLGTLV